MINGSNARTFRLVLLRAGDRSFDRDLADRDRSADSAGAGCDPPQGLVLASAERADLLVDFSDLQPGTELTFVNTAGVPFDG